MFQERDLIRILNKVELEKAIGAITKSGPYEIIVERANKFVDVVTELAIDQTFGIIGGQFLRAFGENMRTFVSTVFSPLTIKGDIDTSPDFGVFGTFFDLLAGEEKSDDELILELKGLIEDLQSEIKELKADKAVVLKQGKTYFNIINRIQKEIGAYKDKSRSNFYSAPSKPSSNFYYLKGVSDGSVDCNAIVRDALN